MSTTVIYHSADYDGIFCREIAKKFLPDANFIGWDFNDPQMPVPDGEIFILDLPYDKMFVPEERAKMVGRVVWIDHHKSSIEFYPESIHGYRIDGVAACRLAWQWFAMRAQPDKQDYLDRKVLEPLAVRLAGEYDVWDHRGDGDLEFQFGLDSYFQVDWNCLLSGDTVHCEHIIETGKGSMTCYAKRDADVVKKSSFKVSFEGLTFLCLNTPRCSSNTFKSKDVPATGHDALMAFHWNGTAWIFFLYHAGHRKDIDLSQIAVKYGGGGHRGACGFTSKKWIF